jgi:hypothetical protein
VLGRGTTEPIRHVQASVALQGEQIPAVLQRHGWTTSAIRSHISDVGFALEPVRRAMGSATPLGCRIRQTTRPECITLHLVTKRFYNLWLLKNLSSVFPSKNLL